MLKVANIIEEGRWGGPQKRIALVADRLKLLNIETVVLFPKKESEYFRQILEKYQISNKQLPLHRLSNNLFSIVTYLITFIFDIFWIYKELKENDYDLIHVSGGAWQFKGPIAGFLTDTKVIWHLNDTSMPFILVWFFKHLGKKADAFFVSARRSQEYYLSHSSLVHHKCYLIQAPVDTAKYNPDLVTADNEISRYNSPIILSISNINPVKGIEVLIEAVAELKQTINDFSVLIVGAVLDTQKEYYKSLCAQIEVAGIEKHVSFLGARENIPQIMKAADIFVGSSHAESSPMSVWEAMSMGMAIVCTDVGDVPMHINSGLNGEIIPVGDSLKLSQKIHYLVDNAEVRKNYGFNARKAALKELDIAIIAKKTAEAYVEIASLKSNNGVK